MSLLPVPVEGWVVHPVPPVQARKDYTCPQCGGSIAVRESHVVAWEDHDLDGRRHWHRHCWRLFARRGR